MSALMKIWASFRLCGVSSSPLCDVSGQVAQPVPLASLKLSMAVYGQKFQGAFHALKPAHLRRALSSIFGARRGKRWKKLSAGVSFDINLGWC